MEGEALQTSLKPEKLTRTKAMLSLFPQHVQSDWYTPHAEVGKLRNLLSIESPEEMLFESSKITDMELLKCSRLLSLEEEYVQKITQKPKEAQQQILRNEYNSLKKGVEAPDKALRALALSIIATKTAYEPHDPNLVQHGEIKDLTMTQRIGLLRAVDMLENKKSKGLVEFLRSGSGKTNILIPTLLPVALLYKPHWDVLTLTPQSQEVSYQRFSKIANILGIQTGSLQNRVIIDGEKTLQSKKGIQKRMSGPGVIFSMREDIGHLLETDPDLISRSTKDTCGAIQDEIDATLNTDSKLVIGGKEEPTRIITQRHWDVERIRESWENSPDKLKKLNALTAWLDKKTAGHQRTAEDNAKVILRFTNPDIDRPGVNNPPDNNTKLAFTLLQRFFEQANNLDSRYSGVDAPHQWRTKTKEGTLTLMGEEDVFRRMYNDMMGQTYTGKLIPEDWYRFYQEIIPLNVIEAANGALSVEGSYFIQEGQIKLMNPDTGYPIAHAEYEPLVTLALYAKESLAHELLVPPTSHEVLDTMTQYEPMFIRYGKIFGFTGTGEDQTSVMKKMYGLDATEIPPQFPDSLTIEPIRTCESLFAKCKEIQSIILTQEDASAPILIDVASENEKNEVFRFLTEKFGDTYLIQSLSAHNADEANEIFESAGKKSKITIVYRMAGREVDIPLEDTSEAATGLLAISTSPHKLFSNEKQFMRRAARNGHSGTFIQLVGPDDEVFKVLSRDDRKAAQQAITNHDRTKTRLFIEKAQETNRNMVAEKNNQALAEFGHYAVIRERVAQLPEFQRENILKIWRDFQIITQTLGASVPYTEPLLNTFNTQDRLRWWQQKVIGLYEKLVAISNESNFQVLAWDVLQDFQTQPSTPHKDTIVLPQEKMPSLNRPLM